MNSIKTKKNIVSDSNSRVMKMNMLGQMAFGIVHDIRNSLQILRASSTMIRQQSGEASLLKNVDAIDSVVENTTRMVERLLSFSLRSEAAIAEIDLRHVLDETLALSEYLLPPHIVLEYRRPDEAMPVTGSSLELSQALLNLIKNAADAIDETDRPGRIAISLRECFPWLELKVEDNGCGIPQDKISHVFDPLFTTKSDGTGLGLANVTETVQSHGGLISVDSEADGTRFVIMLPRNS